MGLTGFNRQRTQIMTQVTGDSNLAAKLVGHGINSPFRLKNATDEELSFLSAEELKKLKGKSKVEEPANEPEPEASEELDEDFLNLPEDTEFPYKIKQGWHYLSNGEKVNGKAKAEKKQAELNGG